MDNFHQANNGSNYGCSSNENEALKDQAGNVQKAWIASKNLNEDVEAEPSSSVDYTSSKGTTPSNIDDKDVDILWNLDTYI